MVFSSSLFILLFLPLVLVGYFSCARGLRTLFLLVASLVFYAWGEGLYVTVLIFSILLNFSFARIIECSSAAKHKAFLLSLAIALNIGMLIAFKYLNFLVDNANILLAAIKLAPIQLGPVHLPIGISFFVFQGISYLMDVYRGDVLAAKKLVNFAMYKSFFPQLIAGPIVRYKDVATQIERRNFDIVQVSEGVERFILGLGKKILIANTASVIADKIFALEPANLDTPLAWLGILCYALQIYFDFSGYSDMAIGLGKMFGMNFLENFNYPYISSSIREFWRRWHISLSSWFRDYLYIPLGGNRVGVFRQYFNLVLVFFLCGFWHGASWTFVVWGLWNGLFLVLERTRLGGLLDRMWKPAQHLYALLVILIGWVFFRADTLMQAKLYILVLFGMGQGEPPLGVAAYTDPYALFMLGMGILASTPLWRQTGLLLHNSLLMRRQPFRTFLATAKLIGLFFVLVWSISSIAMGTNNPFIYFRF